MSSITEQSPYAYAATVLLCVGEAEKIASLRKIGSELAETAAANNEPHADGAAWLTGARDFAGADDPNAARAEAKRQADELIELA